MYRITFEDKETGRTEVYDDLYGCIVAIGDAEGGYGFFDDTLEKPRATAKMLAWAKAMIDLGFYGLAEHMTNGLPADSVEPVAREGIAAISRDAETIKEMIREKKGAALSQEDAIRPRP